MQNFNLIKPEYLSYMAPMGRIKAVGKLKDFKNPLVKGSNYIRKADLPGIRAIQEEIDFAPIARKWQYKLEESKRMAEKAKIAQQRAFARAHQDFNPASMISNYINRFK